jgi:hypothetical protein
MTTVPRILRAMPRGGVTRPEIGIPVLALIRWHGGRDVEVPAVAAAWTRDAVEIAWEPVEGAGLRTDWIPADDVRRRGGPRTPPSQGEQGEGAAPARGPRAARPPRSQGQAGRPRW